MLAVQDVEEADPHDILHCDSLQGPRFGEAGEKSGGGARARESFGIEAVWYKLRAVVALLFSGPAFLNTPFEAGNAGVQKKSRQSRKCWSLTLIWVVEVGVSRNSQHFPLMEKGPKPGVSSSTPHLCDDEISTQKLDSKTTSTASSFQRRIPPTRRLAAAEALDHATLAERSLGKAYHKKKH